MSCAVGATAITAEKPSWTAAILFQRTEAFYQVFLCYQHSFCNSERCDTICAQKWKAKLLAEGKDPEVSRLEAARRGSKIHDWFEQWILGNDPEIPKDIAPWCSRLAASALWKKLDHVICTEHRVCSDEGDVPFAGTLDGLFKIAGQIVLFDLKTKAEGKAKPTKQISNEAMCQLQAYRICLQENYGIHVDRFIALYAFPDKAPFPVAAAGKQLKEHEEHWQKRCEAYQLINEVAQPA